MNSNYKINWEVNIFLISSELSCIGIILWATPHSWVSSLHLEQF